jgi:hypothetical protein
MSEQEHPARDIVAMGMPNMACLLMAGGRGQIVLRRPGMFIGKSSSRRCLRE